MISVLLQSEWPWQPNDTNTFFIYLYVSLYQESVFFKKKTLPTCFVLSACTSKFLFFYVFFHGACKPFNEPKKSGDWTHKYHKMALLFITHFLYWTFSYLLYLLSLMGIFFCYLFVLTYVDSSWRHTHVTTHPTGMQYFAPKWRHLMRFFTGATSRALALLLAFAAGNKKIYRAGFALMKKFELDL